MTTPVLRDRLAALLAPRYVLDRELTSGGMALVFLGHDPVLGRDVAIKVLPPEQATAVARERFLREARVLARLAHPHVVPILEVQEEAGLLWFVMPRIEGDTLAHRIIKGALPLREVQRFGGELLDALAFAHSHGVIHRDVKPANVFLQGDHALLADFGVAQLRHPDDDTLTEAGRLLGTLRYMTPEQLTGAAATTRSDLYSLGATLYEAATGRQWSPALHAVAATWQGLAPGFATVLRRALEPLPERRWPDARSFRVALERAGRRRVPWGALITGIAATAMVVVALVLSRSNVAPVSTYDLRIMPFVGPDTGVARNINRYVMWALEGFARLRVMPSERMRIGQDSATFTVEAQYAPRGADSSSYEISVRDRRAGLKEQFVVRGDSEAAETWGAAIADSLVAVLYQDKLIEFRQFRRCKGGERKQSVWSDYWSGNSAFQQSRWEDAEADFDRAWQSDTTFATALWYRNLSRQFRRVAQDSELTELARHADQLCRPLDELVRVQVEPDLDDRIAGYQRLAREYGSYPPARLLLANELFHRGPLVGRPLQDGVDEFQNSAGELADLDQATTSMQVIWGALRLGEERVARGALARRAHDTYSGFLRLATEGRFRPWLARPLLGVKLWFADSAFVSEAREFTRMGLEFDVPHEQLALGRLLASAKVGSPKDRRADGYAAQATALLLLGRPMAALGQLDSGATFTRAGSGYQLQRWEWRLLLPQIGMPIPAAEVAAGRDSLAVLPTTDWRWTRAAWALMLDADTRRDFASRDRWREALHARAARDSVARYLVWFADAIALGTDGKVDSALARSKVIHREVSDTMQEGRGPLLRAVVYIKRGEWQRLRGDTLAADREWLWHENNDLRKWPQGEPQEGELDAAVSGLVRLRRAQTFLALDSLDKACPLFKRVNELWHDAEPTFRWLRDTVQQGVNRCRA